MEEFIPKFYQLPKKRQYDILVFGYDPDNKELDKINTKIMYLTQNFIYDTKRFISPAYFFLLIPISLFLALVISKISKIPNRSM